MKINWYLKYIWVKLNIFILTPLVWIENKYNEYKEARLRSYIEYQIAIKTISKNKQND